MKGKSIDGMNDIIGSMTFESIFFMLDGGDTSNSCRNSIATLLSMDLMASQIPSGKNLQILDWYLSDDSRLV
jgi:hypothetical protein